MVKEQTIDSAEELAAEVDSGARNPTGRLKNLIPGVCLAWALYQLYIASALPFWLTQVILPVSKAFRSDSVCASRAEKRSSPPPISLPASTIGP